MHAKGGRAGWGRRGNINASFSVRRLAGKHVKHFEKNFGKARRAMRAPKRKMSGSVQVGANACGLGNDMRRGEHFPLSICLPIARTCDRPAEKILIPGANARTPLFLPSRCIFFPSRNSFAPRVQLPKMRGKSKFC
jgi:hypothetical protein